MASSHARTADCFDRLASILSDAAGEAALCAAVARAADGSAVRPAVTYRPAPAVIAGLTAALDAWCDDYARAIDTAQPGPATVAGN